MRRIISAFFCLVMVVLTAFPSALAESEADVFVSPTRNPNAAEYSTTSPEELQPEQIVAHSFILMERSTGEILMAQNEDELMFPASTTKIMTALLALQFGDLNDVLTVSEQALILEEGAETVPFKANEQVLLKDALGGLLVKSGNDAANAIAEYISGDVASFAEKMNTVAHLLGCNNTHFVNPHGLHDELHVTTARDLALIMDEALDNEMFRELIGSATYTLSATERNPARVVTNTNLHIHTEDNYYYKYSIGGKTGFTSKAGYTLVEAAAKDGVELIAVIMYSGRYSRWPDTSRLFEYGFSLYKSVTPEEIYLENPTVLQISGFDSSDPNLGRLTLDIEPVDTERKVRMTGTNEEIDAIIENYSQYTNITWTREARAPVMAGEVMGTLTFYPDGEESAKYYLVATRSIAERSDAPPTLEEIERRVAEDPSIFPPFSMSWILPPVLCLAGIIIVISSLVRLMRRHKKSRRKIPTPKHRSYM